jgi:5-enolpyruvylshikimate-3-phosphate synthase
MNKVFLSHAFNEKESDYIQLLKDELKSHGVQIYETNHLEIKKRYYKCYSRFYKHMWSSYRFHDI